MQLLDGLNRLVTFEVAFGAKSFTYVLRLFGRICICFNCLWKGTASAAFHHDVGKCLLVFNLLKTPSYHAVGA